MRNVPIEAPEGALLNLIEDFGDLAWRKYQQRFPEVWIDNKFQREDRSGYPPFISFRFENEDPDFIGRLKSAIEGFNGAVVWVMGEHKRHALPGINRIVCPKKLLEINDSEILIPGVSAGKYMAEHEPGFGPLAYDDLLHLTAYLRNIFGK
ncbi:hypothetical protein ACFX58_08335 [Sphingomonas sp. NCPPB 2930]